MEDNKSTDEEILIHKIRKILINFFNREISNKELGRKLISPNYFNKVLRNKSKIRRSSLDKIELNLNKIVKNQKHLKEAILVIEKYRIKRGFATKAKIQNWPEYKLIKELKKN